MRWIIATFPPPFWLTVVVLAVVAVVAFAVGQVWAYGRLDADADVDRATALHAAFERGSLAGYADMRAIVRDALAQFPTSLGGRAIARAVGVEVPPLPRYAKPPAFGATDDVRALIVDAGEGSET